MFSPRGGCRLYGRTPESHSRCRSIVAPSRGRAALTGRSGIGPFASRHAHGEWLAPRGSSHNGRPAQSAQGRIPFGNLARCSTGPTVGIGCDGRALVVAPVGAGVRLAGTPQPVVAARSLASEPAYSPCVPRVPEAFGIAPRPVGAETERAMRYHQHRRARAAREASPSSLGCWFLTWRAGSPPIRRSLLSSLC